VRKQQDRCLAALPGASAAMADQTAAAHSEISPQELSCLMQGFLLQ
jgi:hypothetical protein